MNAWMYDERNESVCKNKVKKNIHIYSSYTIFTTYTAKKYKWQEKHTWQENKT